MRNLKLLVLIGMGLLVAQIAQAQSGPDPNYNPNSDPNYQDPNYQDPGPVYAQPVTGAGLRGAASGVPVWLLRLLPLFLCTLWLLWT